jgi:hypothetical protein
MASNAEDHPSHFPLNTCEGDSHAVPGRLRDIEPTYLSAIGDTLTPRIDAYVSPIACMHR